MAKAKKNAEAAKAPNRPKAPKMAPRGARPGTATRMNGKAKAPATRPAAPSAIQPLPPATPRTTGAGPQALYILSDSTGNLARHMLTAFLTQFPRDAFSVRALTFLQNESALLRALDEVARSPGIVLHALVGKEAKKTVHRRCAELGVAACDLTGNFVDFLARESGVAPAEDYSRLHNTDEAYQQRIKAIEFALAHDDGLGLDTLREADLVLTGISRTSKTPTTIYLAQQGYKVGNVALSMDVPPPRELLELPKNRVVGLVIDASQLVEIRTRRQREWGMGDERYNDDDYVQRELQWSQRLFRGHGWPIVNVTDQAVEETAARILEIVGLQQAPRA